MTKYKSLPFVAAFEYFDDQRGFGTALAPPAVVVAFGLAVVLSVR